MINRKNLSQIKCIVAEVDGILTDGKTWLNQQGHKQRTFSVRDSMAIRRLLKAGYSFAVIFHAESAADKKEITDHFGHLGVKQFIQIEDGNPDFTTLLSGFGVTPEECVFMHASTFDLKIKFGISVTVANAPRELRTSVQHVTGKEGGDGALSEVSQLVLDHGSYSSLQSVARKAANL